MQPVSMRAGEVGVLCAERVAETARLVATAMHGDAAYAFLIPDPGARPAGLAEFFRARLGMHVAHRCSYLREGDDGAVTATVTLRPPGGVSAPVATLVRAVVPFALRHGVGVVRRLAYLSATYERLEREAAGGRPYWHVHMMAVRADLQGRGIGRALFADALAAAPRAGAPIVLTTHEARNVAFYERAGFRVTAEETLRPPRATPYQVWSMRRDPPEAREGGEARR